MSPPPSRRCRATPSERIGTAAARKRRQPMCSPPSKRITISATTAIRSTVTNEIASCEATGQTSEATAAASEEERGARDRSRSASSAEERGREKPGRRRRGRPRRSLTISSDRRNLRLRPQRRPRIHFPYMKSPSAHAACRYWERDAEDLCSPCAARARPPGCRRWPSLSTGDGTLSVEDGRGKVTIQARGGVIGRLDRGTVTVYDLTPDGCERPRRLRRRPAACAGRRDRHQVHGQPACASGSSAAATAS